MDEGKRSRLQYLLETAHIPLWLIKDICWLMMFETAGLIIAIPTVVVAIWVAIITRNKPEFFLPNVSIAFWIIANANWMFAEFFDWNTKAYSLYPFLAGVLVFIVFIWKRFKSKDSKE